MTQCLSPILLIIFNRPQETAEVLKAIKKARPHKIFIAADGPRPNNPEDEYNCQLTRKAVEDGIDWPCEKKFLFQSKNLGCRLAVSSALDWFFTEVEEGIILEDDCLPHPDFFNFCDELLKKYRQKQEIMHISGNNFLFNKIKITDDYYFSHIPHIWGWATWRRAWNKYDVKMTDWPEFKQKNRLGSIFPQRRFSLGWTRTFDYVYQNKVDTWDYQWTYAIIKNGGYCLTPAVNLVSNIGFSKSATHTKGQNKFSNLPTRNLTIKNHPIQIKYQDRADAYIMRNNFNFSVVRKIINLGSSLWNKIKWLYT